DRANAIDLSLNQAHALISYTLAEQATSIGTSVATSVGTGDGLHDGVAAGFEHTVEAALVIIERNGERHGLFVERIGE
ncbi:hypothetical protein ACC691_41320, partial [Rhizobium johnstonii]|uniref:hypothetical protein n=1 Tax=Rhizobium johnstonii TaxID=3019933 RepID=UPI003F9DC085